MKGSKYGNSWNLVVSSMNLLDGWMMKKWKIVGEAIAHEA
jgi:hypothetical protein